MNKSETMEAAERGEGCLGRSQGQEPVFVLVARDVCATAAVKAWIHAALEYLPPNHPKIVDAHATLKAMETWPHHKTPD